jgi:hypothetical protein
VTGVLAVVSAIYGRMFAPQVHQTPVSSRNATDDVPDHTPRRSVWVFAFIGFLLLTYGLATVTGLRLILFPPLVVIAYEMFARAEVCPWAQRPLALPLACSIAAGTGVAAIMMLGAGPLSVAAVLLIGIATLRTLRLHMPPALSVGLLPQIMPQADWHFVLAVAIGAVALSGAFLLARPSLLNSRGALGAG